MYYKTSNLAAAAALECGGFPVKKIEKQEDNRKVRGVFCFEDTQELQVVLQAYNKHQMRVEPHEHFGSIKNLKDRIYQEILKENHD